VRQRPLPPPTGRLLLRREPPKPRASPIGVVEAVPLPRSGAVLVFGGTSAVAPLWAGLIARINAIKGHPMGFCHAKLYAHAAALRDITQGNNGDFVSTPGWDACTGLGSPDGGKVAGLFK